MAKKSRKFVPAPLLVGVELNPVPVMDQIGMKSRDGEQSLNGKMKRKGQGQLQMNSVLVEGV
jgi:hypothetical protein